MSTLDELFSPRQTNTALYVQLHERGHSIDEIRRARDAYRICCKLFNGRYRKTERPFICHVVGVASAVAQFDDDMDVVIAGMLHAAYDSGQFSDGRMGKRSEAHRRWLTERVGSKIEGIVARCNPMSLETGVPEKLLAEGIPPGNEDVLVIVLAHELDDLADGGLMVAPKYGRSIAARLDACAGLARQIGKPGLADAIARYQQAYEEMSWVGALEVEKIAGYRMVPGLRGYIRLWRNRFRDGDVEIV